MAPCALEDSEPPVSSKARLAGKVLAIDVSIFIHQLESAMPVLVNRRDENISVIKGLFNRTASMLKIGIKPLFVFDGKPPPMKHRKNTWRDLQKMLTLLGVPFIQAPGEAEATCASLVAKGLAWGTVTEDLDALPFGSTRMIRNLKANQTEEVLEYDLPKILAELKMDRKQFVDLCILLGCDYCKTIAGIGRKKALTMIQKHGNIEGILRALPQERVPKDFPFQDARRLLLEPEVITVRAEDLRWNPPDEEKLIQFLCKEKFLKESDIANKLRKIRSESPPLAKKRKVSADSSSQTQIKDFFPVAKSRRTDKN
ncbi:flap endonuclease 1-like [Pelobates cultripes]|uniref:Flap endonuclease 1-like n=1 Tax=Pelobates cultripes TaxID=61616 RepID=A0AAD1S3A9_PELCU|nr:flap endonuclease 1-like [Pelobates cultripes]